MLKIRYKKTLRNMYDKLRAACPEGWSVGITNDWESRSNPLTIFIDCQEIGYFGPWYGLTELLSEFGY